jgi:AbrB family looped-hinge helix DNA binding protein
MVPMAEIFEIDKSGRIVIPKSLRDKLGISGKTKFILTEGSYSSNRSTLKRLLEG